MADADTGSTTETTDRIEIYADYVCPFCYLGTRSLEQYREGRDEPLTVEWHPFDLRHGKRNPDGSIDQEVDDGKDEQYYEQARQNVRRLQEEYGVEMAHEMATDVDSFDAQVASWYVKEEHPEQWAAFDEAIYTALWQDERDIGDATCWPTSPPTPTCRPTRSATRSPTMISGRNSRICSPKHSRKESPASRPSSRTATSPAAWSRRST